jgi:hypothetical protein
MTDMSDTTPAPGSPSSDWEAKMAAHKRLQDELRPRNKARLFDLLTAACVTHIVVSFDGYSDSGQIERIEAKKGETIVDVPPVMIELARAIWGQAEPEISLVMVADAIEQLVYDFLEDTHAGWENDDGACGDFTFDVAARTITLDYNERYTETQNFQHVF